MKLSDFCSKTYIDESLVRAVVRQIGGWGSFEESANDVTNHGADGGFHGFIYTVDTCKFYAKNQSQIEALASTMAQDLGEDTAKMIQGFRCLGTDYSLTEIGKTLYGRKSQHESSIANALAWFALEEVCRAYSDATERAA